MEGRVSPATGGTARPYDVFINHRGPDVKMTLASSIYHWLESTGLRVFFDTEEFLPGENLTATIVMAIRTASVHVAIFSAKYAESPWCLDELCLMVESGARIIPVFYDVQPSDLRLIERNKGAYAYAFTQHLKKGRFSSISKWKAALKTVSYCSGLELHKKFNCDHGKILKRIVDAVLKDVKRVPLRVAKYPVGLDQAVERFEKFMLESGQDENVKTVGIVGLVGSGKTTLAKEFYNRKWSSFERSSFLFDVRQESEKGSLRTLQGQLLRDLAPTVVSKINSTDEGRVILRESLGCSSRFLIILDNIDHVDQLDALLVQDVLAPGSLIIITSRYKDVLRLADISLHYSIQPLDSKHARELFCWHAFRQPHPVTGFQDLVENFVSKCGGLPLFLEAIGDRLHLFGKDNRNSWEEELKRITHVSDIKLSYDALTDEEKQIFLDIACFFLGEDKNSAIRIWDGSEWSGSTGLQALHHKCLVEFDERNRLKMPDYLRDFGRDIANEVSPCRLWRPGQGTKGRMEIRGIMAATSDNSSGLPRCTSSYYPPFEDIQFLEECSCRAHCRHSCVRLKLLVIKDCCVNFDKFVPRNLLWLRWYDCPHTTFPSCLSMNDLRVLELIDCSFEKLWQSDDQVPSLLRELNIAWSSNLEEFPTSIGLLYHLEKIVLVGLKYSQKILPEEFCGLRSLKHLELRHCESLVSLPNSFGNLANLQHLDFSGCQNLQTLPDSFSCLTQLQYLDLSFCKSLTIQPETLGSITTLRELSFEYCKKLRVLPIQIIRQGLLKTLNLIDTNIQELPNDFGDLCKLEILRIGSPFLTSLPHSLGNLKRLRRLELEDCRELKFLPDSLQDLNVLSYLSIRGTGVTNLPQRLVRLINLQVLSVWDSPISELMPTNTNIRRLVLEETPDLKNPRNIRFPAPLGLSIVLDSSIRGNMLPLKSIDLWHTNLSKISIAQDDCPKLEHLGLSGNDYLIEVGALPNTLIDLTMNSCSALRMVLGISNLTKLQKLDISGCCELQKLPSIERLSCLEEFRANGCKKLQNMQGLENLARLQELDISECLEIVELPSLERLSSLNKLIVNGCRKLQGLRGLGGLNSLQWLAADGCCNLQSIEGLVHLVGRTEKLELPPACWNCIRQLQRLPSNISIVISRGRGS